MDGEINYLESSPLDRIVAEFGDKLRQGNADPRQTLREALAELGVLARTKRAPRDQKIQETGWELATIVQRTENLSHRAQCSVRGVEPEASRRQDMLLEWATWADLLDQAGCRNPIKRSSTGGTMGRPKRCSAQQEEEIIQLLGAGLSQTEVARLMCEKYSRYGFTISQSTVSRVSLVWNKR